MTPFRSALLALIPPNYSYLAPAPKRAFVWPTEHCSIGCAHCNFASRPRRPGEPTDVTLDPAALVAWLQDARASNLVLCGGGEPLDEPEFCEAVVSECARTGLDVSLYTSGHSFRAPRSPADLIRTWKKMLDAAGHPGLYIRLSVDAFHTERLGLAILREWVEVVERLAPEFRLSFRALKVEGDESVADLARSLGATLTPDRTGVTRMVLPSGRRIVVERIPYVLDGRGTLDVLRRKGLRLPLAEARRLEPWSAIVGRSDRLGRPLSRRLTVGPRHVDLEVHANGTVHVLESQPFDARLTLAEHSWASMRQVYYRDPIIQAVGVGGLEFVAQLVAEAIAEGIAPRSTVPFSIEKIGSVKVLDWVTARAVVALAPFIDYPGEAREAADQYLAGAGTAPVEAE